MTDLIAAAKARPGELTYGSWNVGGVAHLGGASLEAATGTRRVNQDIAKVLGEPDVRARLTEFGYEPIPMAPEQMTKMMQAELPQYARVIKGANISLD
jgi:tripartite-type tricarboxylate transporter receptor subunit TctC